MAYTSINKGSDYFNNVLYTGTGSTNAQTGVGFQPDLVWLKRRDNAGRHRLFDAVRGATKSVRSDDAEAEITRADSLTSFDSDGFTLGADSSSGGINVNISGETMVGWNWLTDNTSGSSNTDGSITSTVSANTTSGFSIVSYTGTGSNATVGHGLGVVPSVIMVKRRDSAGDWTVYNSNIGNTNFLRLNGTLASTSQATYWNNTTPTSSVFSVGSAGDVNTSSGTHIAYCFAEKKGFSKFGSYTGNGSTDGTFVYTGFKPAWIMIKRTSGTDGWVIYDNKRETFNVHNLILDANTSNPEEDVSAYNTLDILSNGFKCRGGSSGSGTATNQSGGSYIYMAFAESPFTTSTGVPTTAR